MFRPRTLKQSTPSHTLRRLRRKGLRLCLSFHACNCVNALRYTALTSDISIILEIIQALPFTKTANNMAKQSCVSKSPVIAVRQILISKAGRNSLNRLAALADERTVRDIPRAHFDNTIVYHDKVTLFPKLHSSSLSGLSLFSFNFVSTLYTLYGYLSILFCVKC